MKPFDGCFVCALLCGFASALPRTGTIKDIEHIVVFMQENRAYDHYYGSMRGVRGFNDRAAPLLPSGRSPFYQPVTPSKAHSIICGCVAAAPAPSCTLSFSSAGADVKAILESTDCADLTNALAGAVPPIPVKDGAKCSDLLASIYNGRVEGLAVKDYMTAAPSCPVGLDVNTTAASSMGNPAINNNDDYLLPYPLMFNKTSASCMPAPEMAFACNTKMFNDGNCDGWNTQRDPGYGQAFFNRTDLPFYYGEKIRPPLICLVACHLHHTLIL